MEDNIRAKRRGNPVDPNPQDRVFVRPQEYNILVLNDTGPEDANRIIVLGDRVLMDVLEGDGLWLGDGTFAVVPNIFYQLYTIHTKVGNRYPPCVYFLLPNKTQATYGRMLDMLWQIIPNANPHTILVDFETAAQNAFRDNYPNASIKGCLFHLCQSVIRKVGELGLKREYESNPQMNMAVKSLTALSFVPENEVLVRFEDVLETFPDIDRVDELVAYFEMTYIHGRARGEGRGRAPARFPINIWNHFEDPGNDVPRTTNAVEGYHNGLNSLFLSQHPTMWKLLDGLRKDISLHLKTLADARVVNNPPARQKYIILAERLAQKVGEYYNTPDKLVYLRAVAHLFSS